MDEAVRNLYRDLVSTFQRHGSRVEQMWRSLNQQQREKILRDGACEGLVLKDPLDTSMGIAYKLTPEWNLRDITSPSSDSLLDILKHRATTSLQVQYISGVNGDPGDHAHIVDIMQGKNLQRFNAEYKDCYTLFLDDERYGECIKITTSKKDKLLADLRPAIQAQFIVPQAIGEVILLRQMYLLESLNIVIKDILNTASIACAQTKRPEELADVATAALTKLSFRSPPKKLELSDLVDSALDQKSSLEDYIKLISTEPTVLVHEVDLCFVTRPELIADEKGQALPAHTDQYIREAAFEAVQGIVKTAAVWNYILRLLALLEDSSDKQFRAIVLQELFNTCHLEYACAQAMLKRNISAGSGGSASLKRTKIVRKNGTLRASKIRNLKSLNPRLYYMFQLCQDDTDWPKSAEWLQKLEDIYRAHPGDKDNMTEQEFDSLGDLAVIVTFIQSLSGVVQLPTLSDKIGQSFVSGYTALENELGQLKTGIDLNDFAIPIDNLPEPGMAVGALTKLDEYVLYLLEKTGTKLGSMYQDLVDDCVSSIYKQDGQQKAKAGENKPEYTVPTAPKAPESRTQQRRQNEKTQPTHSSMLEITPQNATASSSNKQPSRPQQTFKVKASTFAVFSSLLSKAPAARGSVSWDAFAAAMADLGFSVVPKVGSIYTFVPPEKVAVQRVLTLHRPHLSCIERPRLLFYSYRLKSVYGWDDSTFVVA